MRAAPVAALTLGAGLLGTSCSKEPPPLGGNFAAAPATTSGDYRLPLDSVPSADGSTFYFTAMGKDAMGSLVPGVFSVPAAGGAARQLHLGAPLAAPFGIAISGDDQTLFVADGMAGYDPNDQSAMPSEYVGQVLTLPAGGGVPAPLTSANGFRPKGIAVVKLDKDEHVYFTGHNVPDGQPGVFFMRPDGSSLGALHLGAPLTDPCGIDVARDGTVYVTNTTNPEGGSADVFTIPKGGGAPTALVSGLKVGYPAGLALSMDGRVALVSGQDPNTNTTVVYRIDTTTKEVATANQGIENNTDAGGLHRAANADLFSWVSVTSGTGGQGVVYRISF